VCKTTPPPKHSVLNALVTVTVTNAFTTLCLSTGVVAHTGCTCSRVTPEAHMRMSAMQEQHVRSRRSWTQLYAFHGPTWLKTGLTTHI
jgi:hypothetical protein